STSVRGCRSPEDPQVFFTHSRKLHAVFWLGRHDSNRDLLYSQRQHRRWMVRSYPFVMVFTVARTCTYSCRSLAWVRRGRGGALDLQRTCSIPAEYLSGMDTIFPHTPSRLTTAGR